MNRFVAAVVVPILGSAAAAQDIRRDPPALPVVAPLSVSLEAPEDALTAGKTGKVRVVVRAHKSDVDLPDLGRWDVAVYRGNVVAFRLRLKGVGAAPRALMKGEAYELEADLPGDRLLLYYEEGKEFNLQGPFAPRDAGDRPPASRAELKVEVPDDVSRLWAKPRPEDEGAVPGKYAPGRLLVQFKKELTLEQAEEVVAALGCRVRAIVMSPEMGASVPVIMGVNFPPDRTVEAAVDRFRKSGATDAVAPDSIMEARPR